jgi:hypothetical protein
MNHSTLYNGNKMKNFESTGDNFDSAKLLVARKTVIKATKEIAGQIEVGMNAQDGLDIIGKVLKEYECERTWHPHKFRIGLDTIKTFREKPNFDIRLKENDLFFLDIGPVFDGHESDYGNTYSLGENKDYTKISNDVVSIFSDIEAIWKRQGLTGEELYGRAAEITKDYGYEFDLGMQGHRISDFPHALQCKKDLGEIEVCPSSDLWVLEVHIVHPSKNYGAFFEDIIRK